MAVVEAPLKAPARQTDVEDVLRAGGFTRFHRRAVAVTGFAWTFVAMEILLNAILWYAAFTALTAAAWGPWSVSAFRFLAGIGLGALLVVDPSMLSEYLPPQSRGRFLVFLDFFWPVGLLLATGLSWVLLDQVGGDSGWRYLFLAASFPAFLAFFARLSLPESPYWLARNGRKKEAAEILEKITDRPVSAEDLTIAEEPRGSVREL